MPIGRCSGHNRNYFYKIRLIGAGLLYRPGCRTLLQPIVYLDKSRLQWLHTGQVTFTDDIKSNKSDIPLEPSPTTSKPTIDNTSSSSSLSSSTWQTPLVEQMKMALKKGQQAGISLQSTTRPSMSEIVGQLGTRLNQITGYDEVADLKMKVVDSEKAFLASRERLRRAKSIYEQAVSERANGQREINALLQRKHAWTDEDVTRFTKLYRNEHSNEQAELAAKSESASAEAEVERRYDRLVDAIRARYHEEQLWSDKIRGASTYGTLALMLINVLLFISVQTVFEPRKREKLGQHVEQLLEKRAVNSAQEREEQANRLETLLTHQQHELQQLKTSLVSLSNSEHDMMQNITPPPLFNELDIDNESINTTSTNVPLTSSSILNRFTINTTNTIRKLTGHQFPSENSWIAAAEGVMAGSLLTLVTTLLFSR